MSSTALITDITTVITNGPNAATKAKAIAPAGPIMDYPGNCVLVKVKFQEIATQIATVITDTDSTDSSNLTLLQGVQALVNGTSSPTTTMLADLKTVITNGPNAATKAKAIAPAGPIMDYQGNVRLLLRRTEEAKVLLGSYSNDPIGGLISITDSTDSANLSLLQGIAAVLV